MQDKVPFPRTVVGSFNISVSIDEESKRIKVYSPAFFWEPFAATLGLIISCTLINSGDWLSENTSVYILVSVIATLLLFGFSLMKRTLLSVFDLSKGTLSYRRGGIYSSSFDAGDQEILLSSISRVGITKHTRRYGDTFQVFLVVRDSSQIEITGTGLSFADAQSCAEALRDFMDIKKKIQAVG